MKERIIYRIGLVLGRRFRVWYWNQTGGKWVWGFYNFIIEGPNGPPANAKYDQHEFEKLSSQIFDEMHEINDEIWETLTQKGGCNDNDAGIVRGDA